MSQTGEARYAANLALYEALVATHPEVEKKGATLPYTSLNGHMYRFLSQEGTVALRLPKEERQRFLEEQATTRSVQYGRVTKEYVEVPDALLQDTQALKTYFAISYAYVASLKPKPTNKRPA